MALRWRLLLQMSPPRNDNVGDDVDRSKLPLPGRRMVAEVSAYYSVQNFRTEWKWSLPNATECRWSTCDAVRSWLRFRPVRAARHGSLMMNMLDEGTKTRNALEISNSRRHWAARSAPGRESILDRSSVDALKQI